MINSTAALVLVGTELVHGRIADENQRLIEHELRNAGVNTVSIHIVRDEIELLAGLVKYLSSNAAYVITVGGLGPTLDDVTLPAVARAFDLPISTREAIDSADYARMSGSETVNPILRSVPESSEIIHTNHGPVVRTRNVYSLPGLPRLVKARLPVLINRFRGPPIHWHTISISAPQSRVAPILERAKKLHPGVVIGCFPSSTAGGTASASFEGIDIVAIRDCILYVEGELAASGTIATDDESSLGTRR